MQLSELQVKDIVNTKDGKRLGRIVDAKVDNKGIIEYFVVEHRKWFRIFSSNAEINVTFQQIVKIGEDVILVDL